MRFLTKHYNKIYDIDNFNTYPNKYYILVHMDKIEEFKSRFYYVDLNINPDISQELLSVFKTENDAIDITSFIEIIYGHFYNKFDDIIYHPLIKSKPKIKHNHIGRAPKDMLLIVNNHLIEENSYDHVARYYNLIASHPELLIKFDGNILDLLNCRYEYISDLLVFDYDDDLIETKVHNEVLTLHALT